MAYAKSYTWYRDDNWINIQTYNAKHVYLYSLEIETKHKLKIPITITHSDIHWQYAMQGGYRLPHPLPKTPILKKGQKHLLQAEKGPIDFEVDKGRHWIIGFNIAASWLNRYPEELHEQSKKLPNELLPNKLYHTNPSCITDSDRATLYYLLGLRPQRHLLQDSQIYVPISILVDQMHTTYTSEKGSVESKVKAIKKYIQQCITTDQYLPTIHVIADQFYINKDHLCRVHNKLYGESLASFINNSKLSRALELLARKVAIHEIAYLLGYNEQSSFSRAFKKKYGITPSDYQNNIYDTSN